MDELDQIATDFAGQIAAAVWLREISDDAAREALHSYARAFCRGERHRSHGMSAALVAKYRRRRALQDACS